jgi:hypothetical protein
VVFGGPLSPLGWSIGVVDAPLAAVLAAMQRHWEHLEHVDPIEEHIREQRAQGVRIETHYGRLARRNEKRPTYRVTELGRELLHDQLGRLDPLQSPPMRELVVSIEPGWTASFTNDHLGGDSDSWAHNLCEALGCRALLATHIPSHHYRYPATQLTVLGPDGDPLLHHVRTISAGVFEEERWQFDVSGEAQAFEDVERYRARRIQDRFNREVLMEYLAAFGVDPDDPDRYGEGILVETLAKWDVRTSSVVETQREYGIVAG